METMRRLFQDRNAAIAMEYAIIAAVVSMMLLMGMGQIRDALISIFNAVAASFQPGP